VAWSVAFEVMARRRVPRFAEEPPETYPRHVHAQDSDDDRDDDRRQEGVFASTSRRPTRGSEKR
jgi:hypothetical protein